MFDFAGEPWRLGASPLELIVRSLVVYAIFLAALRVSGKRELGQFTIFDLAVVLLASNALQPAMTGRDASLPGALVIIVTLFGVNRIVAWGRRRFAAVRRLLDVSPTTIAEDGAWLQEALAHEGLDDEDLQSALREHGLESVSEVRLATMEQDGSISVVPREGSAVHIRQRHRRYRARGTGSQ